MTKTSVLIVDDHPAIRAGVHAVLVGEPNIAIAGAADGERQLWAALETAEPDVVLMDFDLPGEDGVLLCHRVKRRRPSTGVVLYTAFADERLIAPAMLAHADALVSKRARASVLRRSLQDAAADPARVQTLPPAERERLGAMLGDDELSLAALMLSRRPVESIARALGRRPDEVDVACETLLRRLLADRVRRPATSATALG